MYVYRYSFYNVSFDICIGYDVIEHIYGLEYEVYLSLVALFKSVYLIEYDVTAYILWSITILLQISYSLLRRTSMKIYLDDWGQFLQLLSYHTSVYVCSLYRHVCDLFE